MKGGRRLEIGRRLAALRSERNLTQKQVADVLGVDPSMISRVEKGDRELSASQLGDLAMHYNLPPDALTQRGGEAGRTKSAARIEELERLRSITFSLLNDARNLGPTSLLRDTLLAVLLMRYEADVLGRVIPWDSLRSAAPGPDFTDRLLEAFRRLEDEDERLVGALPGTELTRRSLSGLAATLVKAIDAVAQLDLLHPADNEDRPWVAQAFDVLLETYASWEGRKGGEHFTPPSAVSALVALVAPNGGTVFDPACGTGGLLIAAAEAQAGKEERDRSAAPTLYGQEINHEAWRLARMHAVAHGITADIRQGDSLLADAFPELRADVILTAPPLAQQGWGAAQTTKDARWRYSPPSDSDATSAWIQHVLSHLRSRGRAAVLSAPGPLFRQDTRRLREALVREDVLDAIVSCPPLYWSTSVQPVIWLFEKDRDEGRRGAGVLFVDASALGRRGRGGRVELLEGELTDLAGLYRTWREEGQRFQDRPGFAAAVRSEQLRDNDFVLSPARYVGLAEPDYDEEPFPERVARLTSTLNDGFAESERLQRRIRRILEELRV